MADTTEQAEAPAQAAQLDAGSYEIIRQRLGLHTQALRERLEKLNTARRETFGSIESKLLGSERISTANNCVPRDMAPVGRCVLFGYNVFIGLRSQTSLADVFSVYRWQDGKFSPESLDLIADGQFAEDFENLYKYYKSAVFSKFALIGPHLFMVFQVGKTPADIKTFKWLLKDDGLVYCDNRSDHQCVAPSQHEFEWTRATRDMQRSGQFPHVSIEDVLFVETLGGDLTLKVEDNTASGEGIYSEPVDNPDQTLDDAEIHYALVGNSVLLKIRPYQERAYRYIVYNRKLRQAMRIDSIGQACVLLPDGQGLIFPRGYYLQTGEQKLFPTDQPDMVFERRLASPNGEDHLYLFHSPSSGDYVLLSYNIIEQKVGQPLVCNGLCLFDDGTMACFRGDGEAKKHHVVQVWQTPFCSADHKAVGGADTYLAKVGNRDIVRCMAECNELLSLAAKEDTYADLYADIAAKAADIRDTYFWLSSDEAYRLAEPLAAIGSAAEAAIDEYEKVRRTRAATARHIASARDEVSRVVNSIDYYSLAEVAQFVELLAALRSVRGKVISLRELRYADAAAIEKMEQLIAEHSQKLSQLCVERLLEAGSLEGYRQKVAAHAAAVAPLAKASEAHQLQAAMAATADELETLTQTVSNLKIDDATQTAAIIDSISLVYAQLNQARSALKNRLSELVGVEGRAEFASQMKLLDQSVSSFMDLCDTPAKCDESLTRAVVQLEGIEGRFAEFEEFLTPLAEKREQVYSAFEGRKLQLVEQRNSQAAAHHAAALRMLKGIANRSGRLETVDEINGYFASDMMIERVRETIAKLAELGDTVKAEDVASQLKTLQQESLRQLKDRQSLYEDGQNVIRFGEHRFGVNRQELELAIVRRGQGLSLHMTGTAFFDPIDDPDLLAVRDLWDLELPSETRAVYRGEYLAWRIFDELRGQGPAAVTAAAEATHKELMTRVGQFMATRYAEGYVKGVHDQDAARILKALAELDSRIGLLRYPSAARALANVMWHSWPADDEKTRLLSRVEALSHMRQLFDDDRPARACIEQIRRRVAKFVESADGLFAAHNIAPAAAYLFHELSGGGRFVISRCAAELGRSFEQQLRQQQAAQRFDGIVRQLADRPLECFGMMRDWVGAFAADQPNGASRWAEEVAAALLSDHADGGAIADSPISTEVTGLVGSHGRIVNGSLKLDHNEFVDRLSRHDREIVPAWQRLAEIKKNVIAQASGRLRLDEYRPRVLTTFVRNQLIDKVYLPLIGDNLAKQIGAAGDTKRTDRQGLLLLISPPGYGKTTLMEYVANRLGLIFVKVNGPAIGHAVTSLDPAEAPNAAARQEIERLNLAFEMGDNVMIYLDDIQHCNPELLQKFIPLCDGQRRVEGVRNGVSRTYDLRGKRVCVVMAGNPYTESGEKFRIPDMLANRADTYNIGDIVGDNYDSFVLSYLENSLTSNPVLAKLANRSAADVQAVIRLAGGASRDEVNLEGNYSTDELEEYQAIIRKLMVVRDVLLKVNRQYILSAAQADEYRTEPRFLLQGSYRNMNRIAARVAAMMNEQELWTLIESAYQQDAQTLAAGAESNLLKWRELVGRLDEPAAARWEQIKAEFCRRQFLGASDDRFGQVVGQLSAFSAGLGDIRKTLADGLAARDKGQPQDDLLGQTGRAVLDRLGEIVTELRSQKNAIAAEESKDQRERAQTVVSMLEEQFQTLQTWLQPVARNDEGRGQYVSQLIGRFETMVEGYNRLIEILRKQ